MRILVIEDEVLIRALLADELRESGLTVIEAAHADEAWTYLSTGGQADLIFSDIHMPGAMDGVALARQIRARFPGLPIILTSGNPGPVPLRDLGRFIAKPYAIDHAVAVVFETLKLARPGAAR